MKHLGLFEGIGGFSLAVRWMGWETLAWCEWNERCQQLLNYYFAGAQGYGDITKSCFKKYANEIDIITGGFPCQPYSHAGKREGINDVRHLWPEMFRVIREVKSPWIVGENVYGLTNWNKGLVFEQVCVDLENEGYQVSPVLLPAGGINSPQKRERIWFIAYSHSNADERKAIIRRNTNSTTEGDGQEDKRQRVWNGVDGNEEARLIANAERFRQQGQGRTIEQMRSEAFRNWEASWSYTNDRWPVESPVCGGNDGLPAALDGITFSDWSKFSLEGYGNAIVPQIAFELYKIIEELNNSWAQTIK